MPLSSNDTLTASDYEDLVNTAKCLSRHTVNGRVICKAMQLPDGSIVKLFRVKRLLSSARLISYDKRFCRHADALAALGIPTLEVMAVYGVPSIKRTAVHYRPLEGCDLRELALKGALDHRLARDLGGFFHEVHQRGIYFRSIHFGNIVLATKGGLGLIDLADMRVRRWPLGTAKRIRNLRHLLRYKEDRQFLAPVRDAFLHGYCRSASLSSSQAKRFCLHFARYFSGSAG